MGGDPELEAADRANQSSPLTQEEGSDEDDWTPKDAKDLAKKQKQMAKSGITFTSKVGPEAKVDHPPSLQVAALVLQVLSAPQAYRVVLNLESFPTAPTFSERDCHA